MLEFSNYLAYYHLRVQVCFNDGVCGFAPRNVDGKF